MNLIGCLKDWKLEKTIVTNKVFLINTPSMHNLKEMLFQQYLMI